MTLTLRAMTQQEYDERIPALIREYAKDEIEAGRVSADRALEWAQRQTAALLSEGLATDGMLLYTAEADGAAVGWIWVALPDARSDPGRRKPAWIYMIMIEPRYRGRGYGRGIIEAVEHELIIRGVDRLGLNVFGHNTVALRLYESMGFSMTSQQMAKTLTEPSTQQPSTQPG